MMRIQRWFGKVAVALAVSGSTLMGGIGFSFEQVAEAVQAPSVTEGEVAKFADDFFHDPNIQEQLAGAAFVVVKGDEVILKKGYGMADTEKGVPFDPDQTVFRVASISKAVTATAVMQLVEKGKIDLNKDVSGYLGFEISNETDTPLTMRHLLMNATGFAFGDSPDTTLYDPEQEVPLKQYVKDNVPDVVLPPGEYYRYDNLGFTLQGYAVEHVSGESFNAYIKNHIFAPLGMKDSDFRLTPQIIERLAIPYDVEGQPIEMYATYPTELPAGGMLSTGDDMAKFMMAHLSGGKLGEGRILEASTVAEMHKPQLYAHPDLPNMAYGFEFSNQHLYNGRTVVEKAGDLYGYHSGMWLLPEDNVGVFVVVNKDMDIRLELFGAFMDRFFPGEPSASAVGKEMKPDLTQFEGVYGDLRNRFWTTRVKVIDGKLHAEDMFGPHTLTRIDSNLFVDQHGVYAAFKLNDKQEVIAYYYDMKSDSWGKKLPEPERYEDVSEQHSYADYIYHLRQLDVIGDENGDGRFLPEQAITRGEFISWFIRWTGIALSNKPSVFSDTAGNPYEREIQTAYEFGLIVGSEDGKFQPEQVLTRQEAAVIARRLAVNHLYAEAIHPEPDGETDAWALEGVRFIMEKQLYGPEVSKGENGSHVYHSKRPMLRQEAAALLSRFADNLL